MKTLAAFISAVITLAPLRPALAASQAHEGPISASRIEVDVKPTGNSQLHMDGGPLEIPNVVSSLELYHALPAAPSLLDTTSPIALLSGMNVVETPTALSAAEKALGSLTELGANIKESPAQAGEASEQFFQGSDKKGNGSTGAENADIDPAAKYLLDDVDYEGLVSSVHAVDLETRLADLHPEQRQLVQILSKIGPHADNIYRRQRSGDLGDKIIAALKKSRDPRASHALKLLEMNVGPYDYYNPKARLFNIPDRPAAGFTYPEGFTREELAAYVATHPEQADQLRSPYTVVVRNSDGSLSARHYHEEFAQDVHAIVAILREAAEFAKTPPLRKLKDFLLAKAEGLLTGRYAESYGHWINMLDAPVDLVVGPTESYEDAVLGAKQEFTFTLYVKDTAGSDIIDKFSSRMIEFGKSLPIAPEYNPYLRDKHYRPTVNIVVLNAVALGGDSVPYPTSGWTLPNEPEIAAEHGKKLLLVRNVHTTKGFRASDFIQRRLFGQAYDPDTDYWHLIGHELAHTIVPRTLKFIPDGTPMREKLKDLSAPIEEIKADLVGLMAVEDLAGHGLLSHEKYREIARMYVAADAIETYGRNPDEAHAKYKMVVYNLLREKGAISYDAQASRLRVHPNFPQSIRAITAMFLKIEAEGDKATAESLLRRYNYVPVEVRETLEALSRAGLGGRTFYNVRIRE